MLTLETIVEDALEEEAAAKCESMGLTETKFIIYKVIV